MQRKQKNSSKIWNQKIWRDEKNDNDFKDDLEENIHLDSFAVTLKKISNRKKQAMMAY